MHEVLLNVESKEIRYAYLKHGQLHDLIYDRRKSRQMKGNIYRGKVINIIPNMESAFVDFSEGGNGFIHLDDLLGNARREEMQDIDFDEEQAKSEKNGRPKEIKIGQSVLVQVHKEPIGTKGARLTSNISVAGRYLVLLPNSSHRGVSRKIEDRQVRDRLKKQLRSFELPEHIGLICRTSAAEASPEALYDEAGELMQQWETIAEKFSSGTEPTILYEESDLVKRSVMQCVDKKFDRLLVDDLTTFQRCKLLYQKYEHEHPLKIELYRDKVPMYERFSVEREIDKALRRKVWLGSGGYLFFDRTEAMYTIDVNSGRSSQNQGGGDVEETLVRINLEAAEEIARQLRIRNVGGLIVCDFIDMRLKKNQKRVLDRMRDCMKEDSAKCTILGMSEFGLIEMTRQRSRESLSQTIHSACPYCAGSGVVKSHETVTLEIERDLKKLIQAKDQYALKLITHPELNRYLNTGDRDYYLEFAEKCNAHLEFGVNDTLHISEYQFYSTTNGQKIDT